MAHTDDMANTDELLQSILSAVNLILKNPGVLEDGTDRPWQHSILQSVDVDLWSIAEAAEE